MSNPIEILLLVFLALNILLSIIKIIYCFLQGKKRLHIGEITSAANSQTAEKSNGDMEMMRRLLREYGIDRYDSRLTWRVLSDAGITQKDIRQFISKTAIETSTSRIEERHLLEIISKYILELEGGFKYGNKHPINTQYYVCSVEASRDPEYLNWMVLLLCKLISSATEKQEIPHFPNFILTPKGGNIVLGRAVAERLTIPFITSKYSLRGSHVDLIFDNGAVDIKTNYEGSWQLFEQSGSLEPGNNLYGIVVDDTTATGEQIVDAITDFNDKASRTELHVLPIEHAFTLFCAVDDDKCRIDDLFCDKAIQLHRYFDLSEEAKMEIVNARGEKEKLSVYSESDKVKIDSLLTKLEHSV